MTIYNSIEMLSPKFGAAVRRLNKNLAIAYEARVTKTLFQIFETYRDPLRQADLLKKGTSKAGMFQSAHQFGLAADFVPYLSTEEAVSLGEKIGERVMPGWSWHSSHDYTFLRNQARAVGLDAPISWDPCHIEHLKFPELRRVMRDKFE